MDDRKKNFEEKKIFRQNCLGGSTFSAFSKVQKSTSKGGTIRRLNVPNFCYF
jgi:hypothetical protein